MGSGGPKVLVIGDLMVDVDVKYEQTRTAPEGCPVLVEHGRFHRPGGAAAVAVMAAAFGADVAVAGLAGGVAGRTLLDLLRAGGVSVRPVLGAGVKATQKTRIYVDGQLRARIDDDSTEQLKGDLLDRLRRSLPDPLWFDVVLVADHGKGVVNEHSWHWIAAQFTGVPILVDPASSATLASYAGASAIVANRREAFNPETVAEAEWRAAQRLSLDPGLDAVVIKLDQQGFVAADRFGKVHEPSLVRQMVDPVGAGDAFLAAMGLAIADGRSWFEAARAGNAAAAAKCAKRGAVPVTREEIAAVEQHAAAIGD